MRNRREDFRRSRLRPGLKAATLGGRRGATEPLATTAERNRRGHDDEAFEPASRRPPHRDLTRPPVLFHPDVHGAERRHAIARTLASLDDGWWPAWPFRTPAPPGAND